MNIQRVTRTAYTALAIALIAGCAPATPSPVLPSSSPSLSPRPSASPSPCPLVPLSPSPPTHTPKPSPPPTAPTTSLPIYKHKNPPTSQTNNTKPPGPWEPLPIAGLPGPWVDDLAFATPSIAFAVADADVYRSDDGGRTWTLSLSIYRGMRSLAVSPAFAADGTVFAADGRSLVFRSTDGGHTWEEISRVAQVGGASDADVWLSISPEYPTDPTLWATVEGGVAYRSTDGGLTWAPFDPGVELDPLARLAPNPEYPADPALEAVAPPFTRDLGDVNLPGALAAPSMTASVRAVAAVDGVLLLGTMRGLYRSTDGGATWSDANVGLPASAVGVVAVGTDGTIYAGVSGDPRPFRLPADGARWEPLGPLPEGDFGTTDVREIIVLDRTDAAPGLVVTTGDGFVASRDGGLSWEPMAGDGLPPVSVRRLEPLFAGRFFEHGMAHLAYSGRVYRTEDGGDSWTRVEDVTGVKKLLQVPDGRVIALARGAVYEWSPASSVGWVRHAVGAGFGGEPIVARFVSGQLAVAVMDGDVYLSRDGGRGWARVGRSELESARGYLISPRFDADRAIYAQGAAGVYVSADAGRTWVEAGEGLPSCEHYDSPECGLELLEAVPTGDDYALYATVRHDFHTRLWRAHVLLEGPF